MLKNARETIDGITPDNVPKAFGNPDSENIPYGKWKPKFDAELELKNLETIMKDETTYE